MALSDVISKIVMILSFADKVIDSVLALLSKVDAKN